MSNEIFVDWLTATQHYPGGGLPIILGGIVVWYDREGNVRLERGSASSVTGSYDTSIRVGCDGARIYISGNVGRFNRADNLFNFGWAGTWAKCNRILAGIGLPDFTAADRVPVQSGGGVGARLHRLDITSNFCAGSESQARAVIRWLSVQSISRMRRGMAGDESVWWSNTRHMFKAYLKGREMVAHGKDKDDPLVAYCDERGVVRVEVELRRRLLQDLKLDCFGDVSDERLEDVYRDQTSILRRVDRSDEPDILGAVPSRYRMTAAAWLAGQDLRALLSRSTLFRHGKVLREYGMDVFVPRNVVGFPVRVRVIDMQPMQVPEWYLMDAA